MSDSVAVPSVMGKLGSFEVSLAVRSAGTLTDWRSAMESGRIDAITAAPGAVKEKAQPAARASGYKGECNGLTLTQISQGIDLRIQGFSGIAGRSNLR